jgi:uncharacterized protein YdeI (YjbR/CyaY-like superfamily)
MSTASPLGHDEVRASTMIPLPRELADVLDAHDVRRAFERLPDRERWSFASYVSEAKLPPIRERRAALVAMRLRGVAGR